MPRGLPATERLRSAPLQHVGGQGLGRVERVGRRDDHAVQSEVARAGQHLLERGEGGGAGAGIGIDPIGFLVTKGDEISFISTHQSKGLSAAFEKIADLLAKFKKEKESQPV